MVRVIVMMKLVMLSAVRMATVMVKVVIAVVVVVLDFRSSSLRVFIVCCVYLVDFLCLCFGCIRVYVACACISGCVCVFSFLFFMCMRLCMFICTVVSFLRMYVFVRLSMLG